MTMLKNAILLFVRNLRRQKLFSIINLLGLTVSIASALLIYLYVRHELSYDRFHQHADRVYRVNQTFIWGERDKFIPSSDLLRDFPLPGLIEPSPRPWLHYFQRYRALAQT